jgi:hypothetical protein
MMLFWVVKHKTLYFKYHSYTTKLVLLCRFHELRFKVLTAPIMKIQVFSDTTLCGFVSSHLPIVISHKNWIITR